MHAIAGLDPGIVHMANSAAIVSRPSHLHARCGPGAILYGYHQFFEPSSSTGNGKETSVRPVLSFARELFLRDLPVGARWVTTPAGPPGSRPASQSSPQANADGAPRAFDKGRVIVAASSPRLSARFRWTSPPPSDWNYHRSAWATLPDLRHGGGPTQSVPDVARIAKTASATCLRHWKARPKVLFALTKEALP